MIGKTSLKSMRVNISDNVAEVTLLGPGPNNAMGPDMWRELPEVFSDLDRNADVRAIVLTGSEPDFTHGLDLLAMSDMFGPLIGGDPGLAGPRTKLLEDIYRMQASINAVADCRKPIVAAIDGLCIGGGLDLVSAADFRYASSTAEFSLREVKLAIVADTGSLARLPHIVGDGIVRELAFTGRNVCSAEALRIGLVNQIFADRASLLFGARETAKVIAQNPPLVVHGIKNVLNENIRNTIADSLRYVAVWNSAFVASHDMSEAVGSILERRQPKFRGE